MNIRTSKRSLSSKVLVIMLSLMMMFTMMPTFGAFSSFAADELKVQTPALLVTGSGLIGGKYNKDNVSWEKSYSLEDLKALDAKSTVKGQLYSGQKSQEPYNKIYSMVDGVKISAIVRDLDTIKDEISIMASDGYATTFKNGAAYTNDGKTKGKPGLASGRKYYDGFTGSGVEVPAVIAWAYTDETGTDGQVPEKKPTSAESQKNLRLYVGQYNDATDMNSSLYNGGSKAGVNKILVGDEITETVLTVNGKKYTRADLLMMDYAERTYSYQTKAGDSTDFVRGVPFSVLLKGVKSNAKVSFKTVDGYDMSSYTTTAGKLIAGNYMLGYSINGESSYLEAKDDANVYGFLTLYGDNAKPSKMVNYVKVESGGVDFSTSPFKHITNGGIDGLDAPYNIDAITGATLTIEGPGTKSSVPLSVRDLENQDKGCYRGNYTDIRSGKKVTRTYEGVDLYYILNNMSTGDNGIKLTDEAKKVVIKDRNRKSVATFTLKTIKKMHNQKRPILVAYGTSYKGKSETAKPFVFDDGAGGDSKLGNYDGCLKLVYDRSKIGSKNYKKFKNMAYIYVEESARPGYKHNKSPYKSAENSQYVLTITGQEVGREVNFTVKQLENMVKYDKKGKVKKSNYAYRGQYSLANSTYWYVNEYEGIKLWSLLQTSGIKNSKKDDKNTYVTFQSTDNYGGFDTFSLYQVAHPSSFGFYEKNALDLNDGKYEPVASDLKKTGYPVLVAYGVNGYPYVRSNKLDGYKSGLQNDGGPLRVISGKMDYKHANGSNQAKLLDKVIVGSNDYHYATHAYHEKDAYTSLASEKINVTVKSGDKVLKTQEYSVADIEKLLYNGTLTNNQMTEAKVKDFYETKNGKKFANNLYEGLNLNYFLTNVVELPGSVGDIKFTSTSGKTLTKDLETVLELSNGYNKTTGMKGLSPVLAYAKNGSPLVASKSSAGYEGKIKLASGTSYARSYSIYNNGGPLKVVFPRKTKKSSTTLGSLDNLASITINLTPDNYSHTDSPYDQLASQTIKVSGEGTRLSGSKDFTVSDLEGKQKLTKTVDYSIKDSAGKTTQMRYRGIPLYDLLNDTSVALKNNADKVIVTGKDGSKYTFGLNDLIKSSKNLPALLAYGSSSTSKKNIADGKPLVESTNSEGYDAAYANDGGPIKLVVGQSSKDDVNANKMIVNVKSIEVTAKATTSWNHSSSAIFEQYLTDTIDLKVVNSSNKEVFKKTYTVKDLENMQSLIFKENITSTQTNEWEGIDFWKFIEQETKSSCPDATKNPISVFLKAKSDGFKVDVLQKVGLDGLQNGVKDGAKFVPVMLGYGMDGLPLSSGDKTAPNGPGYDSTIGNNGGPIRLLVHNMQGACLTGICEITINIK